MSMIHANVPLVNKNIYNWFVKPICFAAPNGVATHSLTSPVIEDAAGCLSKDGSQKKHLSQRLCHHLIKKKTNRKSRAIFGNMYLHHLEKR